MTSAFAATVHDSNSASGGKVLRLGQGVNKASQKLANNVTKCAERSKLHSKRTQPMSQEWPKLRDCVQPSGHKERVARRLPSSARNNQRPAVGGQGECPSYTTDTAFACLSCIWSSIHMHPLVLTSQTHHSCHVGVLLPMRWALANKCHSTTGKQTPFSSW